MNEFIFKSTKRTQLIVSIFENKKQTWRSKNKSEKRTFKQKNGGIKILILSIFFFYSVGSRL